jgi:VWFA-related protein
MDSRFIARSAVLMMLLAMASIKSDAQKPTPFGTTVDVTRILTEVRVVDSDGSPILGLGPEDFWVKVGGEPVEVESVLWIPSTAEAAAESAVRTTEGTIEDRPPRQPEGRLIVILFQVDYAPRHSRTVGLVRMAPRASEFVAGLGPGDKVALFVYSSHLQLRADFTDDLEVIAEMVKTSELLHGKMKSPDRTDPSIGEYFDIEEGKDAASMARALELIGDALQSIPGTKSLVFFGYALGRMSAGHRVTIGDGYPKAMEALSAARTSVFALDITDADYHSLEIGLRAVAEDTGGLYVKTHLFPESAMTRLVQVISSYYELSIVPPPQLKHPYLIDVKVKRRGARIYVRQNHPTGRR